MQEQCNESDILYLPIDFKQLCQKAGEQLKNITVEEVASEVNEGNMTLHREMSVIFSCGASNRKRQKIIPFPANVCTVKRSSDTTYPSPHVPNEKDIRELLPFPSSRHEGWEIITIDSKQQMSEILNSSFMTSKILGIDFEADHDHLSLMCITNYDPEHIIYAVDLISNGVREMFHSVFGKMLENSSILKIGHSLKSLDRPKLLEDLDCMMVGMYDTQIVYKLLREETIGLDTVLFRCEISKLANRNTKKAYQLWNWCKRPIDTNALNYAAMDVAHLAAIMTIQFEKYPEVIGEVLEQSNK